MLVLSVWIPRLWCRGFCPLGAALRICGLIRRRALGGGAPSAKTAGDSAAEEERHLIWLPLVAFSLLLFSNLLLFLPG